METDARQLSLGPYKNVVFLGGGTLLRKMAAWSAKNEFRTSVVTSPRHIKEKDAGVSLGDFLEKEGIPYIVAEKIDTKSVLDFIPDPAYQDTFYLSLGAAWIFKKDFVDRAFGGRLLNAHGTRLPQNRGGGGFSWQIMMGNRFGFCVLHFVDGGVDTGEIVDFEEFLYPHHCRIPADFEAVYIQRNFNFITRFLLDRKEKAKAVMPRGQAEYFSTYWPRLNTDLNGWIDWRLQAHELERFICAFDEPYGGARTLLNGSDVRLKSVSLNFQDGYFHPYQAGLIYRKSRDWICICAKGAGLVVERVIDEFGRNILQDLRVGDRFHTPQEYLEKAKIRTVYTPTGFTPSASRNDRHEPGLKAK